MTDTPTAVIASANPKKVREIVGILHGWNLIPRPEHIGDVDETEDSFLGNARLKADAIGTATGLAALADDSGLEVAVLDGAPGVASARYAGVQCDDSANVARLLAALDDQTDRRARFRSVVVFRSADGREVIAEGVVEGTIAPEPRGSGGFGYDPVFVPDEGDGRTFAEMSEDEKHTISHRGRALRELAGLLGA